jgi:hypothetical protein
MSLEAKIFPEVKIAFTTAFKNPMIDVTEILAVLHEKGFKPIEQLTNLPKDEENNLLINRIGKVEYPHYIEGDVKILSKLHLNKNNSFLKQYAVNGIYFQTLSSVPFTILEYQAIEGKKISLQREFKFTTIYWLDAETIIVSVILESEKPLGTEELIHLEHPRGLIISKDSIDEILKVGIYSGFGNFKNQKTNLYLSNIIIEFYLSIVRAYNEKQKSKKFSEKDLQNLHDHAAEIFRSVTFNSVIVSDVIISSISNEIPSILTGYSGFSVQNTTKYISDKNLSLTNDTTILLNENRFLAVLDKTAINATNQIRTDKLSWLIWGILTGEITSFLMSIHHTYHQIPQMMFKEKRHSEITGVMGELIALSSRLSDPNFLQTPLMRLLVNKSRDLNRFDETLESMKGNFDVLQSLQEQTRGRRISYMILGATVLLLFLPSISPTRWNYYYIFSGVVTLLFIYFWSSSKFYYFFHILKLKIKKFFTIRKQKSGT